MLGFYVMDVLIALYGIETVICAASPFDGWRNPAKVYVSFIILFAWQCASTALASIDTMPIINNFICEISFPFSLFLYLCTSRTLQFQMAIGSFFSSNKNLRKISKPPKKEKNRKWKQTSKSVFIIRFRKIQCSRFIHVQRTRTLFIHCSHSLCSICSIFAANENQQQSHKLNVASRVYHILC